MSNRSRSGKVFWLLLALSVIVIAVGAALMAALGFNHDGGASKILEVGYDTVIRIEEREEELQQVCENAFTANGIEYTEKEVIDELDTSYFTNTGDYTLRYTFDADVSDDAMEAAKASIASTLTGESYANADIVVTWHTMGEAAEFNDELWRGAIALSVGVILALVYIAFRFGIPSALTGLVFCAHDALLTAALFAIVRIPVLASSVLVYASLAAIFSLFIWMIHSGRMRENFKEPSYKSLDAEEAVAQSYSGSKKTALFIVGALAAVLLVVGGIATSAVRLYVYSALIPLVVCTYSSLVLAPGLYGRLKAKADRSKAKRSRYAAKKKKEEQTEA